MSEVRLYELAIRNILFQKMNPERAFDVAFKKARAEGNRMELYVRFLDVLKCFQYVSYLYPELSLREAVEKSFDCEPDPLFSFPEWVKERLIALLGEESLRGIYKRYHWIRVNTLKVDVEKVRRSLERKGFYLEEDNEFPFLFKVEPWYKVSKTEEFSQGLVIPQDKASVISVKVLDPKPYETIVEIGGAPGVKTSLIQQLTDNRANVVSIDVSTSRVEVQRKLLERWGVRNVELLVGDGAHLPLNRRVKVFIDAPCTNSGTVNVDPSVFMRLTKDELMSLVRVQRMILREAMRFGSDVVYTTCSLFPEEGEKAVEEYQDKLVKVNDDPTKFGYRKSKVWLRVIRTYPHVHGTEGFFIAKLSP
ncbi:MAG: RsmB/NOP family class I SAM-dependent RNA methyltransferase [Candidatus Aramenus sp.]|nr:RsmB/NOP family class I SAM-dependent RNA methyltransferase [Candidatus Aramenus sp.]